MVDHNINLRKNIDSNKFRNFFKEQVDLKKERSPTIVGWSEIVPIIKIEFYKKFKKSELMEIEICVYILKLIIESMTENDLDENDKEALRKIKIAQVITELKDYLRNNTVLTLGKPEDVRPHVIFLGYVAMPLASKKTECPEIALSFFDYYSSNEITCENLRRKVGESLSGNLTLRKHLSYAVSGGDLWKNYHNGNNL
jgi:hypothetical protein